MRVKGLLLIFLASLAFYSAPERLAWSENRRLVWEDFKGKPDVEQGWAATTSSGISQSYEINGQGFLNKATTKVTAYFYPEYSWVRNREKTAHLLGHEQTHFDITEYHARKLKKRIKNFEFTSNSKEEVKNLYAQIEEERIAMQRLFDSETEHSTNHTTEIQWEFKIARLLRDMQKK